MNSDKTEKDFNLKMNVGNWEIGTDEASSPLNISQEVLRSVLYGKWCNAFGGQKELTFKSSILEKVEYNSDEGKSPLFILKYFWELRSFYSNLLYMLVTCVY